MKILKIIGVLLIVALIIIQFYPKELNQSDEDSTADISRVYQVPEKVQKNLQVSCYDCHSNNTEYPWYNKVQPVALFLENHIKDGKEHLNFSEFGNYTTKKQKKKLKEISEEVEEGEMPLTSYTLIHWDAKISDTDKKAIIDWADNLRSSL